MTISLHEASAVTFLRGHGILRARLAPDMFTLAGQVQSASDAAKLCAARLAGVDRPGFADTEASFAERRQRIARTVAFLEGLAPAAIAPGRARRIPRRACGAEQTITASAYLLQVARRKADYLGLS